MRPLLLVALLLTQADPQPAFEAASVRPHHDTGRRDRTRTIEPGRLTWLDVTLGELISAAYGVKHYQISGPEWITGLSSAVTFDVIATAGKEVPVREIKRMLGQLLAARFHLAFHHETRELPIYALVVAKGGPKFRSGDGGQQTIGPDPAGGVSFQNYSMENFADWLTILPSLNRPVIDHTGLTGAFTFRANLFNLAAGTPPDEMKRAMIGPEAGDNLRAAIPDLLGLRFEAQKSPIVILVIDHADKVPTEN
jgi:uncharacterized protein (TIGR03435 family)